MSPRRRLATVGAILGAMVVTSITGIPEWLHPIIDVSLIAAHLPQLRQWLSAGEISHGRACHDDMGYDVGYVDGVRWAQQELAFIAQAPTLQEVMAARD